jgi:hypothetical protein
MLYPSGAECTEQGLYYIAQGLRRGSVIPRKGYIIPQIS